MFDPTSRYANIADATYSTAGGREIVYKERRFLPKAPARGTFTEVEVLPADRLDLIAARSLGNPLLFWKVADANLAMNPFHLTTDIGRWLKVPKPTIV